MRDAYDKMVHLHTVFDLDKDQMHRFNYPGTDQALKLEHLRVELLREEFEDEYLKAETENDVVGVADALADIIVIAITTAVAYGIPIVEVFEEVHRSNMRKVGADGKIKYREDGKLLKPDDWEPPDIAGILRRAGFNVDGKNS